MTEVNLPDEPPPLTPRAARVLLDILIEAAERDMGPDWRAQLREQMEAEAE